MIERRDALQDELELALSKKKDNLEEEKKRLKAKEDRLDSSVDAEISERKHQDELERLTYSWSNPKLIRQSRPYTKSDTHIAVSV